MQRFLMECGSAAFFNGVWKYSVVEWSVELRRCRMECGNAPFLNGVWKCIVFEWSVEVQHY